MDTTEGLPSVGVEPARTAVDASGAMQTIESGLNTFAEDVPWLMRGLDDVAKIHPAVTGVLFGSCEVTDFLTSYFLAFVVAFKIVFSMFLTRREDDKRIIALFVELRKMVSALLQYVIFVPTARVSCVLTFLFD